MFQLEKIEIKFLLAIYGCGGDSGCVSLKSYRNHLQTTVFKFRHRSKFFGTKNYSSPENKIKGRRRCRSAQFSRKLFVFSTSTQNEQFTTSLNRRHTRTLNAREEKEENPISSRVFPLEEKKLKNNFFLFFKKIF
jgi:hypothetical protein